MTATSSASEASLSNASPRSLSPNNPARRLLHTGSSPTSFVIKKTNRLSRHRATSKTPVVPQGPVCTAVDISLPRPLVHEGHQGSTAQRNLREVQGIVEKALIEYVDERSEDPAMKYARTSYLLGANDSGQSWAVSRTSSRCNLG